MSELNDEIETARLAAQHYGRPESDVPALVAFERHRAEQAQIPGMPGLSGALPNFIAGFHAARRAAPVGEVELPALPEPYGWFDIRGSAADGYTTEQVRQAQRDAYEAGRRSGWFDGAGDAAELIADGQDQQPVQSIDSREFRKLLDIWGSAAWGEYDDGDVGQAYSALIAYIDGRAAGAAPDGWKLVPVEPTEAMVHAAQDLPAPRMFGVVYRAMIAAAPSPQPGREGGQ